MAGGSHEKEHGEREPEGDARGEEIPAHQAVGFGRHGSALFRGGAGPLDKAFLAAPDDAPGVQEHDQAESAADADGQVGAGGIFTGVDDEGEPGGGHDYYGDADCAEPNVVEKTFGGELQRVDEGVGCQPNEKPEAEPFADERRIAGVARVGRKMDLKIAQADEHGD